MTYPKITVVTINLNNAAFLEDTIRSVVTQGYPNLEYIIIDGGSTDGSIDIIKKYEPQLAYWVSEKDNGYAFALQKGLSRATGDIMAWLNSDDVYLPGSLFTVAEIFRSHPNIQWITGFPSWCNKKSFHLGEMPLTPEAHPYWAKRYDLYQKYGRWSRIRYLGGDFLAIQQESTFWRRELWQQAGGTLDTSYKLGADTELWCRFFRYQPLYTANAILAAFRSGSEKQLTKTKRKEYLDECWQTIKREVGMLSAAEKFNYRLRFLLARFLKPAYYFDLPPGSLYEKLLKLPRVIKTGSERDQKSV